MNIRPTPGMIGGVIVAALLAPAAPHAGQTPQSQQTPPAQTGPVFRSTTTLVEVDVMVHDDSNRFVSGLTADDLELYEDGKPQVIRQCYLVAMEPSTGETFVVSNGGARPLGSQAHRLFVLVFDEADLETSALLRIKKGAEDFLNANFHEGDFGGVVVDGQLYQGKLTRSKATLVAGVRAVKPAFDSRDTRLRPFREFPRIPGEMEAARLAVGDRMLLQDLGDQACRDDPVACNQMGGLQETENALQRKSRQYIGQARDATRYTMDSIQHVIGALSQIPGRKTVVFFSDGFFSSESTTQLRQLAGLAARADTAIYGIDGRGLSGGPPQAPDASVNEAPISGGLDTSDDGPFMLADGTGAFVVRHATDIAHALDTIADDTSTYYVVGYRPTNSTMDGKFRKITVKAKSPGLHIRARTGYIATPLPPLIVK